MRLAYGQPDARVKLAAGRYGAARQTPQNGGAPSTPAKRSPHSRAETAVETARTRPERRCQSVACPCERCTYHPRPIERRVRARKGQVSTRNAGAAASPAPPVPRRPSRPGTTHHQGSGRSSLSGVSRYSIASQRDIFKLRIWMTYSNPERERCYKCNGCGSRFGAQWLWRLTASRC